MIAVVVVGDECDDRLAFGRGAQRTPSMLSIWKRMSASSRTAPSTVAPAANVGGRDPANAHGDADW